VSTEEDFEARLDARIDARIEAAIREERSRSQRALHQMHADVLDLMRQSIEAALGRSEAETNLAMKKMLASTDELLRKFDTRVRECLEQDRKMLGLTVLHDRRMN
jgi:hypothetical protein